MFDEHDLIGLLLAYIDGDTLARKALVDALEELGDPRLEQFREEAIDWNKLACRLSRQKAKKQSMVDTILSGESARMRFRIDCERFGSETTPEVKEAVRQARQAHVKKLFPELDL
jgi:hypothetical protein